MDYQLKKVKNHTKAIEQEIDNKSRKQESLDLEIDELETELDSLPFDSPKRYEIQEQIAQKKEQLENTNDEIKRLEKDKPEDISFMLREGFLVKLNPNGSRSIEVDDNFSLKLPSHRLPLTTTRNLRTINLAFPFKILKDLHVADIIFSPKMENHAVPSVENRKMGHLILNSLGIDDSRILSEESIKKLRKDLAILNPKNGKTNYEHLIDTHIFDVDSFKINKSKLRDVLISNRKV